MENTKNIIEIYSIVNEKEKINFNDQKFKKLMFLYKSALEEINTRVNLLKDEFKILYNYDLINYTKTRIKSPDSIINKMKIKNYETTYKNLIKNINDIAGIRIICKLKSDVFIIKKIIKKIPGIKVIKEKDYISNPKKSGYSSYHLIIEVPINLSERIIYVKVEVQIRTIAMDFWADIEHKVKYKPKINVKSSISEEVNSFMKIANDKKVVNI